MAVTKDPKKTRSHNISYATDEPRDQLVGLLVEYTVIDAHINIL